MNYNTYSESDMESETNFQQPTGKISNNNNNNSNNFVRNNSIKNSNKQQHKQQQKSTSGQRRASDCSYYGKFGDTGDNISYYGVPLSGHKRSSLNGTNGRRRSHSHKSSISSSSSDVSSRSGSSTCSGDDTTSTSSGQPNLPYPGFVEFSFRYLSQEARPRNWCLQLITNPWFERISMLVILLNCITLGMFQPCVDDKCEKNRCKILQIFDDVIFAFFSLEMTIKMIAMGGWGRGTYLADSWNRLDFFIVMSGALEYFLQVENLNLTAIRTIRVLRPLRAINRIPSMRILVMLLLDTLPMLGNVLLLCFFVFFIFGIIGVQLWEGILRQRCVLQLPDGVIKPDISFYYEFSKEQDYICSKPEDSGMHLCSNLPPYRIGPLVCNTSAVPYSHNTPSSSSCVNWNQYYTNCTQLGGNPFQGTISFDNIGLAWVAIFLVISLEGWTDIMYYVQDAHSFWDWIYFVLLIVIGSFFMINLCLVVIATQFSETKKREMERMRQERARFTSSSTLASSTNNSEPTTCYAEIVKYIAHLYRRLKRRLIKKLRLYKYQYQQRKEGLLPRTPENLFSPQKIRCHHPKCPKLLSNHCNSGGSVNKLTNLQEQNNQLSSIQSAPLNNSNNNHDDILSDNSEIQSLNNTLSATMDEKQKMLLLKIANNSIAAAAAASTVASGVDNDYGNNSASSSLLSPPTSTRRRGSSVMFNEFVILHTPPKIEPQNDKNTLSVEKMTQTGEGGIWQVNLPHNNTINSVTNNLNDYSDLNLTDAMTCQELLALSVAFSAALPTGQTTLDSFYSTLTRNNNNNHNNNNNINNDFTPTTQVEDYSCCYELYQQNFDYAAQEYHQQQLHQSSEDLERDKSRAYYACITCYKVISKIFHFIRKYIKRLVDHKYFQQGILLAILINTLSMGIEYHNQPEELTAIVETSNIVFSAIFAVEMLLKIIAEGPFKYISNGFNVFDGVIVILSAVELCQSFVREAGAAANGSSGLSVLRTFRLLRILKLVRFMPNLRRQLFVMLRTMDNVAIFFSLLILFIFIFSILGMNLFGCKFCEEINGDRVCDRKNFDTLLWSLVTVFQILTQEDWNVVLFNGMEKTSHWAALYFVTLMTFGNYVLFNLLVAILVEGFSSERHERREREQREIIKAKLNAEQQQLQMQLQMQEQFNEMFPPDDLKSFSESTTSESYNDLKHKWCSAEELRKLNNIENIKCNIQKQKLLQGETVATETADGQMPNYLTKSNQEKEINQRPGSYKRKHQSIRDKNRLSDGRKVDPPIITTTAATPQDSPSNTMEMGTTMRDWEHVDLDSVERNEPPRIHLTPPSVFGSLKALDERIFLERPTYITKSERNSPSSLTSHSEKHSPTGSAVLPTCVEQSGDEEQQDNLKIDITITAASPAPSRKSSLKVRRGSSKRKKVAGVQKTETSQGTEILNNCKPLPQSQIQQQNERDENLSKSSASMVNGSGQNEMCDIRKGSIQSDKDILLARVNCIKNDTHSSGQYSRMNVRRSSSIKSDSHQLPLQLNQQFLSNKYINNHQYYNFNRKNSINVASIQHPHFFHQQYYQRRMSSFEHPYEKHSNINLHNFEDFLQRSMKVDLEKSISSLNNSTSMMQEPSQPQTPLKKSSKITLWFMEVSNFDKWTEERDPYSLYLFSDDNIFRKLCNWFVNQKWFDNVILFFIALNCITLAMERPNIPPWSKERVFLATANYVFTVVFAIEMLIKVVAAGMFYGRDAYFTSGWNIMDGSLVMISIIDLLMGLLSESSPRIFGILRVFRLLRSLRPLRVINRAPGLKLVVQTLLSSLRPIGNIVLICCTFFIIFGILGVQLFKGTFFYCEGENIKGVRNKTECLQRAGNAWINRKYNFDDLGKALMSLFVLSSRDGWVNIMYTGLDAVGVDQQPIVNYNEWRLLYFIAFILLVGFFVLNMFVGVVVENFHRCREEQEKEEKIRRAAKRAIQLEKKRRRMHEPPYYTNYSPLRMFVHNVVTSKYFDLAIAAVIGLNVVTMAMEYYMMPIALEYALKIFNYFFTAVFILEALMKLVALGFKLYLKDKWNQLDVFIVILSIVGIVLEEMESKIIPINPTIIRVMRVLRIARVLKLLKMAKGIRALLDTVMQALPQVGNLGLLFFLLFFIFAALGVELFGRLECSDEIPCQGLGEHAHFANFGMAFLTLFRVATGDNWNGIMKDTLRDECDDAADCVKNCCVSPIIAPIFFVIFVLMAQFVLVNVVVAVLMKHLEESHKQMEDDMDIETELEREIEREQLFEEEQALCKELEKQKSIAQKRPLTKVASLPSNFTYSTPIIEKKFNTSRRQTVQYFNPLLGPNMGCPLSLREWNQTPISTTCESNDNDLNEPVPSGARRSSKAPINRRNLLQKFRTQSFDVKLLSDTGDAVEMDSQNIKFGQSNGGGETSSSAINNNLMISKKPTGIAAKKLNYRQSSLDFDNRSSACKFLDHSNNNASSFIGNKSFLAVPKLQATTRSRSGSAKQLFKQAAIVDEDEQINENSLLLPEGNTPPSPQSNVPSSNSIPQIQLPSSNSGSLKNVNETTIQPPISVISSSSSSSSSVGSQQQQFKISEPTISMHTLTVDDGGDGNVKKSESCELLRVISERRKL
ncbi:voltage-dependent T-type calcium channel subunit alpha-1G isoform X8 [Chironomus tepperi]|uniref:voltage-dependent T-type calcium channel subunit alpha-1G isoform X8 n=1 Tax=Chironomus tepperi TaxID=113505 RepID=UPI00391F5E1D